MSTREVRAKVDRAREHLTVLAEEIDRFAGPSPLIHLISRGERVTDHRWLREPPMRWSTIVGDCVHNLRSALDHMVWDMSGGSRHAPSRSEFPIFVDQDSYLDPRRGGGLAKIEGIIDPKAKIEIDLLQPYHRDEPTTDPLWVLHELDRVDKHRALHPVLSWASAEPWRLGIHDESSMRLGFRQIRATQGPHYPDAGVRGFVKRRADLIFSVTFPRGTIIWDANIEAVLTRLVEHVEREVLRRLEPFLEYP